MDPNVEAVRAKLLKRSEVGLKKYGCTTENLAFEEALKHAQEVVMDLAIYIEQILRRFEEQRDIY